MLNSFFRLLFCTPFFGFSFYKLVFAPFATLTTSLFHFTQFVLRFLPPFFHAKPTPQRTSFILPRQLFPPSLTPAAAVPYFFLG